MASSRLLKIPLSGDSEGHILVQVSHRDGHADLDVTLFATESEAVYKTKVKQKKLKELRSSRYNGSDDEWETVLRHFFLSEKDSSISPELRNGLEMVATVTGKEDNRALTITFRNRIDQITQKLGSIEIKETEEEIQLFDWASGAVEQQTVLQNELSTLRSELENDRATITALQSQIADLVKAKREHEEQLISKFTLLLNEKKLKIRNQQRILSTAKVDKEKQAHLKLALEGNQRQSARKKRRADQEPHDSDQEKEESDGFETMDVDHVPTAAGNARSSRETTPETETESEDGEAADRPATATLDAELQASKPSNANSKTPPPPRALPFAKKGAKKDNEKSKAKSPEAVLGSDEETASEDDEL